MRRNNENAKISFGNIKTQKVGIKNDLCFVLHIEKE